MENLTKRINIGHGKFGKNLRSFVMKKLEKIIFQFLIPNLINVGPFDKAIGPGKESKNNRRRVQSLE